MSKTFFRLEYDSLVLTEKSSQEIFLFNLDKKEVREFQKDVGGFLNRSYDIEGGELHYTTGKKSLKTGQGIIKVKMIINNKNDCLIEPFENEHFKLTALKGLILK